MMTRLFLICPTDFLETKLNKMFKGENYFLTSLANSIDFGSENIGQIKKLLIEKNVEEIIVVIRSDNNLVKENHLLKACINNKALSNILKNSNQCNRFINHFKRSEDTQMLFNSCLLNNKVQALQNELKDLDLSISVDPLIYNSSDEKLDKTIHPVLTSYLIHSN